MSDDPVVVRTVHGQMEGQIFKIFLESAGIPVMLSQESAGVVYGLSIGDLGAVDILVPPSAADQARKLLDAYDRGELVEDSTGGDEDEAVDEESDSSS
jgi:hypothetical protein